MREAGHEVAKEGEDDGQEERGGQITPGLPGRGTGDGGGNRVESQRGTEDGERVSLCIRIRPRRTFQSALEETKNPSNQTAKTDNHTAHPRCLRNGRSGTRVLILKRRLAARARPSLRCRARARDHAARVVSRQPRKRADVAAERAAGLSARLLPPLLRVPITTGATILPTIACRRGLRCD